MRRSEAYQRWAAEAAALHQRHRIAIDAAEPDEDIIEVAKRRLSKEEAAALDEEIRKREFRASDAYAKAFDAWRAKRASDMQSRDWPDATSQPQQPLDKYAKDQLMALDRGIDRRARDEAGYLARNPAAARIKEAVGYSAPTSPLERATR